MAGGTPFSREALPRVAGRRKAFVQQPTWTLVKRGVVGLQVTVIVSVDRSSSYPATCDVISKLGEVRFRATVDVQRKAQME